MQRFFLLGAALLFASLIVGSQSAAAAPPSSSTPPPAPKLVAEAIGEMAPFAVGWLDAADGTMGADDALAGQIQGLFGGAHYRFQDNSQIVIGQVQNSQFYPLFTVSERHDDKGSRYVFHLVAKSGKSIELLDGSISRDPQDPTKGLAILTLHLFSDQGDIGTTYMEQNLQFQKLNGQ
jgi:hypothetical protein